MSTFRVAVARVFRRLTIALPIRTAARRMFACPPWTDLARAVGRGPSARLAAPTVRAPPANAATRRAATASPRHAASIMGARPAKCARPRAPMRTFTAARLPNARETATRVRRASRASRLRPRTFTAARRSIAGRGHSRVRPTRIAIRGPRIHIGARCARARATPTATVALAFRATAVIACTCARRHRRRDVGRLSAPASRSCRRRAKCRRRRECNRAIGSRPKAPARPPCRSAFRQ